MSNHIVSLDSHRIINVMDEEYTFFDEFLKKKNIEWLAKNREIGILPLNRAYVGYIRTPIRKIDLTPKYKELSIEHVIRLYNYVYSYQDSTDDDLLGISKSNKSIVKSFLDKLREQLHIGILQEYEEKENKLNYLKGKIDYVKTYKNSKLLKSNPVHTNSFELSLNLNINKLISGALIIISKSKRYGAEGRALLEYFQGVEPCLENASELLNNITFTSKTNRFKRIATDASMIIDALYYNDTKGSSGGESFLVNFDALFELFVRKVLLIETNKRDFSIWKNKHIFAEVRDNNNNLLSSTKYIPDLLYKYKNEDIKYGYVESARAIIDVKNKAQSIFKNADIYQIMFYNQLLYAQCNILVYPSLYERDTINLNILHNNIAVPNIAGVFIDIAKSNAEEFKSSIRNFITKVYRVFTNYGI